MSAEHRADISGLYLITDEALLPQERFLESIEPLLACGARLIQYRAKKMNMTSRIAQATALRALCNRYDATLIINDSIELAKITSADGVHLGKDDARIDEARQALGDTAIIGVSCYNDLDRAITAQNAGANYVAFGAIFPSSTKPQSAQATLNDIKVARATLNIPVVAIGGIDAGNAEQVLQAGANALAIIGGVLAQERPLFACKELLAIVNAYKPRPSLASVMNE